MSKRQRLVLIISILASSVAFLDSSVVNVALPSINRDLGGGLATQQWVVDAYLISLGSLILLAGSLSDLFGRKKILLTGLIGFGLASLLCAFSPNASFLIISRAIQGVAGALLVPSSLALIISNFEGQPQGKAIGTWTAWTGISFIIGPLLGGFLVDQLSWRWIFAINIIPIAISLILLHYLTQPEHTKSVKLDVIGAILCSLSFSTLVFGLIEQTHYGWRAITIIPIIFGLIMLISFIWYEKDSEAPMLPLSLFKINNFKYGNLATIAIYGGLSIATFLIVIFLQEVAGYSAFKAGLSLLPITIISFLLSPRFGALSGKYGPRLFMSVGPLIAASGFLFISRLTSHLDYASQLLPGVILFALGLSITVAPLTEAVLGDIHSDRAGIASAVNNAISRIAGLITIAIVGVIAGSTINVNGFHRAIGLTAALVAAGGIISAIGIRNNHKITK